MKIKDLIKLLHEDRLRWDKPIIKIYFMKIEYRLILRFRLCNFFSNNKIFYLLYIIERLVYYRTCIKCGCEIPSRTEIGGGFKIIHPFGIVINSKAKIGKNFTIVAGSVIGKNSKGVPKIGDNVYVGAKALIIGNVNVEDNSIIGAGAIVTKNVEMGSVMCNDGAHCIKKQGGSLNVN